MDGIFDLKPVVQWPNQKKGRKNVLDPISGTSDEMSLVTAMTKRLKQLELHAHKLTVENQRKDSLISKYEQELSCLRLEQSLEPTDEKVKQWQIKCEQLETQLNDMHKLLQRHDIVVNLSTNQSTFEYDFDLLKKRIDELNLTTGYGIAHVSTEKDGSHRLKIPDPLSLAVYKNGIYFRQGPFRSFENLDSKLFLTDILDGYLPLELRDEFPDGVPIELVDHHTQEYQLPVSTLFMGEGHSMDIPAPSFLNRTLTSTPSTTDSEQLDEESTMVTWNPLDSIIIPSPSHIHSLSTPLPPTCLSTQDAFLSKLPKHVIKNGRVISLRADIQHVLQGDESLDAPPCIIPVPPTEPSTSSDARPIMTRLRITGPKNKHFLVKLDSNKTIQDVLNAIQPQLSKLVGYANMKQSDYELRMAVQPPQLKFDKHMTLFECGLVPNARMHIIFKSK